MLCKMLPKKGKSGSVPVYLNVYDLTPVNGYAYWVGLGVYHSGVQVHEVEYAFGAHDHPTSGIFEVKPKHCPGFTFRKSILIGRTDLGVKEVHVLMEKLTRDYPGNAYHLIRKNCNHFCDNLCVQMTGNPIPSWVNRLARLGLLCKCVLPAALNETKIQHVPSQSRESCEMKKEKLRRVSRSSESMKAAPASHPLPVCSSSCNGRRQRRCIPTSSSLVCTASTSTLDV